MAKFLLPKWFVQGFSLKFPVNLLVPFAVFCVLEWIKHHHLISNNNIKKARYHQVSESDQKRLETAQSAFASDLSKVFASLVQTFCCFESIQANLSPQDRHNDWKCFEFDCFLVAIAAQLQIHPWSLRRGIFTCFSEFVNSCFGILPTGLLAAFPPFGHAPSRLLIAGRIDACGSAARRALMQAELLIHPAETGAGLFRVASEAIVKVFERPEPIVKKLLKTKTL